MDLLTLSTADRHRVIAARFEELVGATTDWQASTPVVEWTAVDVVGHLIEWLPGMLEAGGVPLAVGEAEANWRTEPLAAWQARSAAVQAIFDDPAQAEATYRSPMLGEMPVNDMLDRFWTADIFMHSWDLARAGGLPLELDAGFAGALLAGLEPMEDMIRSSGQFGTRQPVPAGATVVDQLIAFIGRDPAWSQG